MIPNQKLHRHAQIAFKAEKYSALLILADTCDGHLEYLFKRSTYFLVCIYRCMCGGWEGNTHLHFCVSLWMCLDDNRVYLLLHRKIFFFFTTAAFVGPSEIIHTFPEILSYCNIYLVFEVHKKIDHVAALPDGYVYTTYIIHDLLP